MSVMLGSDGLINPHQGFDEPAFPVLMAVLLF
jgi:hypothetical protein